MARADLDTILKRIDVLDAHIEAFVPIIPKTVEFRADLAGLTVVAIAAAYESCVKETLISFAGRRHESFGLFTQNNYGKLNSRVSITDLYGYARLFGNEVHARFGEILDARKRRLESRIGKNIATSYKQILSWRHDFAHAGIRNTTVEEALATHRIAKRVLYAFDDAFCDPF